MKGKRSDALVCSATCKERGYRHLGSLTSMAIDPDLRRFKDGSCITLRQRAGLHEMAVLHPDALADFSRRVLGGDG
jgi:hypothetical protein